MNMFQIKSVTGRIFIGKMIGLVIGIIVLLVLPTIGFAPFSLFGLGTLLMFVIMGAMIGFAGQFDRHPAFNFKMPWWVRGSSIGFMFMLMYILLAYPSIEIVIQSNLVSWIGLSSPFWTLLDGIIIGMIMGLLETKIAGEGSDLPLR